MTSTRIIALCGKGGVGKTSISALLVKLLMSQGGKILAIDADPAVGFATALGIEPERTINDIRNDVIDAARRGETSSHDSNVAGLDYSVFEAMAESEGFAFLAIGRPETEGCYCRVNEYLRAIIESLSAKFDYVIIDGEAGIEQINRRVMETVTHLLLVSDASRKGINVIRTIKDVADSGVMSYERVGAVINRVRAPEDIEYIDLGGIELLGAFVEDDGIRRRDIQDVPLLTIPDDDPVLNELRAAMVRFGVIEE